MKPGIRLAILMMVWTMALVAPSRAQTQTVIGQAGVLGEWEVSATVTRQTDGVGQRWGGPLSMKHIGFCSADGPEEKTGELRLSLSDPPGEAIAALLIDGTECTFTGHLEDGYHGVLACPGRSSVPMVMMME